MYLPQENRQNVLTRYCKFQFKKTETNKQKEHYQVSFYHSVLNAHLLKLRLSGLYMVIHGRRGGVAPKESRGAIPPPPHFFACQLRGQSFTLLVIIPLPQYANFGTTLCRKENLYQSPPPPPSKIFRAGAASFHFAPPPPLTKHPAPPPPHTHTHM